MKYHDLCEIFMYIAQYTPVCRNFVETPPVISLQSQPPAISKVAVVFKGQTKT